MYNLILSRTLLVLCGILASVKASAFAVFIVPFGVPVGVPFNLNSGVVSPGVLGSGVPLTWKQTSVNVTLAFSPNPPAPLINGTTTWNQNALSAIAEWNAVGANFAYAGAAGGGNPCTTDGVVVAAFDPSVCIGVVPPTLIGLSRVVAVVDSPGSARIIDADVAIISPNTPDAGGSMVTNAFDGPQTFPNVDFRRVVLHELGHSLGLAHPDTVFGDNSLTRSTVMHSQIPNAFRLSADDKNGALALYPEDDGGGGNALILALMLGTLVLGKALWPHLRRVTRV